MSKIDDVRNYTYRQIQFLIRQKETSVGKAMLANLRRGIGKTPGELPELWGAFLNEMPSELYGNSGMPSEGEWAVYIALTLFALHQQGNAEPVHCEKVSLGTAAARLMNEKTEEERGRILRRFGPVVTAKSMQELSHHLRGLIQLCKAKGVRLDYVQLAGDIYRLLRLLFHIRQIRLFSVFSFWRAGKKYSFRGDKTFIMLKKEKNNEYLC